MLRPTLIGYIEFDIEALLNKRLCYISWPNRAVHDLVFVFKIDTSPKAISHSIAFQLKNIKINVRKILLYKILNILNS